MSLHPNFKTSLTHFTTPLIYNNTNHKNIFYHYILHKPYTHTILISSKHVIKSSFIIFTKTNNRLKTPYVIHLWLFTWTQRSEYRSLRCVQYILKSEWSNGWIFIDLNKTELTWKWTSYCSTWTTPCQRVRFRSPPSIMRETSRCTTYPKIGMIQRWNREKSVGDQNCLAGVFPFVFQENFDDDFHQTDYVPSNSVGQLVEECEKNNISKNQHDPTVDSRDMATGALLVPPNSAPL